jgi:hypothetical protein
MSEPDPIGADAREAAHVLGLGPPPHVCVLCGYSDPLALIAKPLPWIKQRMSPTLLQKHHVVGKQHDGQLIVLLCLNCHQLVHRRYLDAGVDLRFEVDPITRVSDMLEARAAFGEHEAESFRRMAALLRREKTRKQ